MIIKQHYNYINCNININHRMAYKKLFIAQLVIGILYSMIYILGQKIMMIQKSGLTKLATVYSGSLLQYINI